MERQQIRSMSYNQLAEFNSVKKQIAQLFEDNSEIIISDKTSFEYEFATKDYRFHFAVGFIKVDEIHITATIIISPKSLDSNSDEKKTVLLKNVPDVFREWISHIKHYNKEMQEYESTFYEQFEKDFEDVFEDNNKEFGTSNIDRIVTFLDFVEVQLENEDKTDPEIQKLIVYNKEFKNDIHSLSHDEIKRKFIKLSSGFRKHAKKFMKGLMDAAFKKMYGMILNGGIDIVDSGFHNLLHHL